MISSSFNSDQDVHWLVLLSRCHSIYRHLGKPGSQYYHVGPLKSASHVLSSSSSSKDPCLAQIDPSPVYFVVNDDRSSGWRAILISISSSDPGDSLI